MLLQIIMCGILVYPLILSFKLCKDVWALKSGSWMAGTLLKFLPDWLAMLAAMLLSMAVLGFMLLIILMKPV